jgi:diaminohydroxyphosphoribosylaminopyrimidine deaminase/5-amino-6-(5-phosphoribosylamino)uracil reductase
MTRKRPYTVLKLAATLDGRIATHTGQSQWITGERARREVHRLRSRVDAIVVGVGTVVQDDPRLTVRTNGKLPAKQPVRVVLDPALRTPPGSRCLAGGALIATAAASRGGSRLRVARARRLQAAGAELVELAQANGSLDLGELSAELARREVTQLLVEGGGETAWHFLSAGLVDEVVLFYAPLLIGGREARPMVGGLGVPHLRDGWRLRDVSLRRLGDDIMIRGFPCSPDSSPPSASS